mmetsp:Transcript_84977/g.237107  ORF Transcript_84977/g.237107 Transcript_84977/m.237107 type:complete len:395 (+) Transcript_84977:56-1240(+)
MASQVQTAFPLVCLDFNRPEVAIIPILSFLSSLVKGLSGMGEAIVFGAGWQLFYMVGFEQMSNIGLLAGFICVMQCFSTAMMASKDRRNWWRYRKIGAVYSSSMLCLSPLGNHVREIAAIDAIQLILAAMFLGFSLLKLSADGIRDAVVIKAAGQEFGAPVPCPAAQVVGAPTVAAAGVGLNDCAHDQQDVSEGQEGLPIHREPPSAGVPLPSPLDEDELPRMPDAEAAAPTKVLSEPVWLMKVMPFVGLAGGFLGGLCGMNGPPFILLVAFTGLDKAIARSVFPMGQAFEVWALRLPILLLTGRIALVDSHLYVVGIAAGFVGLSIGNCLAPRVSQLAFERLILVFLVLSSLSVLGILQGHPRALLALGAVAAVAFARILCTVRRRRMDDTGI